MSCGFYIEVEGRQVPCGKCQGCRRRNRRAWVARMMAESAYHEDTSFVTLTYDDDHLPTVYHEETDTWIPTLVKSHPQKWIRSVRDRGHALRYFFAGEYGEKTSRPHYHAIIFGLGLGYAELFQEAWGKGFVSAYAANARTMSYVAKYTLKGSRDPEPGSKHFDPAEGDDRLTVAPFRLTSRNPALGTQMAPRIGEQLVKRTKHGILHDPEIHSDKVIRIGGEKYPLDRMMRTKVVESLTATGVHPLHAKAIFNTELYVANDDQISKAKADHKAALRKRHKRTKL